jgi:hypothetical protein
MQLVIRPLITAGVALAGASVVAVTPLTAPVPGLPDVQSRAVVDQPVLRHTSPRSAPFTDEGPIVLRLPFSKAPIPIPYCSHV